MKSRIYFTLTLTIVGLSGCSSRNASTENDDGSMGAIATTRTVSLEVPEMHCPFACWPKVKKTLEAESGVGRVTLAEQKEKNIIDNRVVHVAVSDEFDTEHAVASLAEAGFEGAFVKKSAP